MDYNAKNTELLRAYRDGNKGALEQLILDNKKLIYKIAHRFSCSGKYDVDDLFQEGCIGLLRAVEKYDFSYDVAFSTYATKIIKMAIIRSIHNTGRSIRIPEYMRAEVYKMEAAAEKLYVELEREPSNFELARYMGITIYEIEKLKILQDDISSLDQPIRDTPEADMMYEIIPDDREGPEAIAIRNDTVLQVRKAVNKLNDKRREVIYYRYLREPSIEQKEIASWHGVSRQAIFLRERKALSELRRMPEIQTFRIEERLDNITNFHRNTERVVMWREQQRRGMHYKNLEAKYGKCYFHKV